MRWRIGRVLRDLSGRSSADLIRGLLRQVDATIEGAQLARSAAIGESPSGTARERMQEVEHAGDAARGRVVTELGHSLVTPIDREDIFRLSRSIDDVLDNLRDFVRELDLFQTPDAQFVPVIDEVMESLRLLREAIADVARNPAGAKDRALTAKKACNEIRRTYQVEIAQLLSGEVSTGTIKRRELLRRLDVVGLRLGDAIDDLADGVMKRAP